MARVVLTSGLAQSFTGGVTEFDYEAANMRRLIRLLEEEFPGIADAIELEMAVAIDGEIYQDPFLEPIQPDSEVYFIPKIGGG